MGRLTRMRLWLRTAWRRLRGRCVICNGTNQKAVQYANGTRVYGPYPHPDLCFWCAKRMFRARQRGVTVLRRR